MSGTIREWRPRLAVTYGLVTVENTFELLYPFAIGLAVDGLLDDSWGGVVLFAVISLSHTAVSFSRQRYDSRSFAKLYELMASELVERQRTGGVDTSSIVGRANLAGEYVEFMERDIPLAITAAFAVFGSLVMLFFYDPLLGLVAALVAVPVALLNRRLMHRSRRIFRRLNDETEVEVDVIDTGTHDEVRRHFGILGRQWVRLSDAEASSPPPSPSSPSGGPSTPARRSARSSRPSPMCGRTWADSTRSPACCSGCRISAISAGDSPGSTTPRPDRPNFGAMSERPGRRSPRSSLAGSPTAR
jgi:hypothetical protein